MNAVPCGSGSTALIGRIRKKHAIPTRSRSTISRPNGTYQIFFKFRISAKIMHSVPVCVVFLKFSHFSFFLILSRCCEKRICSHNYYIYISKMYCTFQVIFLLMHQLKKKMPRITFQSLFFGWLQARYTVTHPSAAGFFSVYCVYCTYCTTYLQHGHEY